MSPILIWEGPGEVPNFCPQGCGGLTEDPYGGPCKACWDLVNQKPARCRLCCEHGVPLTRTCSLCQDREDGVDYVLIPDDEQMWLCPHGVGVEPGGDFAHKEPAL